MRDTGRTEAGTQPASPAVTAASPPPRVSGGAEPYGHLEELRTDPIGLMRRVREECGDVGAFRLGERDVVLVSGPEANEWFFRMPDATLDQGAAYPFMTPIFGRGVVFDAPPERRQEMLRNSSLRGQQMKGHAETIAAEVERMVARWDTPGFTDEGTEIDLLDWFAELTIYTSSACLIGRPFRERLDGRFADLFADLERGTDALSFIDPYAPIETFRRRDEAREQMRELISQIMADRAAAPPARADRDLLDVLMTLKHEDGRPRFTADEITGMFISMMFAGHHTSSGTAAWTLIELLRHPEEMAAVVGELDELFADGGEVGFKALRAIPRLESVIKEALRLHPPLIILMRAATEDLEINGHRVKAGDLVAATPAVSNRLEVFTDPDAFDPARYRDPRREDDDNPWAWIPFGAGRHRCVGAAFAMMQLKAIFCVLLQRYSFTAAQPLDSYRNDHSKIVVQLERPCSVHVRPRQASPAGAEVRR
ncbi:cytochrome P450 [Actinocorallia populi]|uniref:cytochrome P450 n=1 Tax=Actinocorallia populi TaxID=2079200 RepID=UPI000D08FE68|nr:cytochrome P450 [Actinocorallia populi]